MSDQLPNPPISDTITVRGIDDATPLTILINGTPVYRGEVRNADMVTWKLGIDPDAPEHNNPHDVHAHIIIFIFVVLAVGIAVAVRKIKQRFRQIAYDDPDCDVGAVENEEER